MKYVGALLVQQCLAVITPLVLAGVASTLIFDLTQLPFHQALEGFFTVTPLSTINASVPLSPSPYPASTINASVPLSRKKVLLVFGQFGGYPGGVTQSPRLD